MTEEPTRSTQPSPGADAGQGLWQACVEQLAQDLPEQQFNTWIKPLVAQVAEDFGMWPFGIALYGEWWRLLTAAFLHGSWLHIAFNMYVLFLFGPVLERVLQRIPLGRVATPDEIAAIIAFCALDAPESMTGTVIDANGASYVR